MAKEVSKAEILQEYKCAWRLFMFKQTVSDVLKMVCNLLGNRDMDYAELIRRWSVEAVENCTRPFFIVVQLMSAYISLWISSSTTTNHSYFRVKKYNNFPQAMKPVWQTDSAFSTLIHGDVWSNNIMVHRPDESYEFEGSRAKWVLHLIW